MSAGWRGGPEELEDQIEDDGDREGQDNLDGHAGKEFFQLHELGMGSYGSFPLPVP